MQTSLVSSELAKIRINENSDDVLIVWDICREEISYNWDAIVVCELCWVGVHQRCYGRELEDLPEDDWYWERWRFLVSLGDAFEETAIKCMYWDDYQGAIVQVRQNQWAHLQCVHWIPEISLDKKSKELIGDVDKRRWEIPCDIWVKSGGGVWLRCDYPDWGFSFHIRWASKRKVIKKWRDMKLMDDPEIFGNRTPIYCNIHYDLIMERMNELRDERKQTKEKRILDIEMEEDNKDEDYEENDESYTEEKSFKYTVKEPKSILNAIKGGDSLKREGVKKNKKLRFNQFEISKKIINDSSSKLKNRSIDEELAHLQTLRESLLSYQSNLSSSKSGFLGSILSPSLPIVQSSSNLASPLQIISLASDLFKSQSTSKPWMVPTESHIPSFIPHSPYSKLSSDTKFKLSGPLSKILDITIGTRDEIMWAVSSYTMEKGLQDKKSGNLLIYQAPELFQLMQKKVIQTKDIFDSLHRFLQPVADKRSLKV